MNSAIRKCSGCGETKGVSAFYRRSLDIDTPRSRCIICTRAENKEWGSKNPKRMRELHHNWLAANRETARARVRAYAKALKLEMIAAYGGACCCCGEANYEFLTLDHVGGGGAEHRRKVGSGMAPIRDLKKRGWPKEGFRVLCSNCNGSYAWFGYCPHQTVAPGFVCMPSSSRGWVAP